MRHYSCDLCGKDLTLGTDARYVVRMEVSVASEPALLTPADLDQDSVEAMAELLDELEADGLDALPSAPATRPMEYDLCPTCHRKFLADPLGRMGRKFHFSKN